MIEIIYILLNNKKKPKNEDRVAPFKYFSSTLYEWKVDDEFVEMLHVNLTSEGEDNSSMFVRIIDSCDKLDFNNQCLDIVTLVDAITWKYVCNLEVDGTLIAELESLINEEKEYSLLRLITIFITTKMVATSFKGGNELESYSK